MKIVIIGGAKTAINIADQMYDAHVRFGVDVEVIGFAFDDYTRGDEIYGYPILCGIKDVYEKYKDDDDVKFVYSFDDMDLIKECSNNLCDLNIPIDKWYSFIHPSVFVARSVKMGYGNVVLSNCVINAGTIIGNFNILNSGVILDNDVKVGSCNVFSSQIRVGGMQEVGNMCHIDKSIERLRRDKLIIVGLSKTALHVLSFVEGYHLYDVIGFAVNEKYKTSDEFNSYPVFTLEHLEEEVGHDDFSVFVAMLWNHLNRDRRNVYEYCKSQGYIMANLISPLAVLRSPLCGDNCWIHDYVVIQQNSHIGSDVAVMSGTLIGANTNVGSHCFFGARSLLGGGSTIGEQTFIGINSIVFDDTHIGNKCIVGACTPVKRNMPDFSRYVTKSDDIIIKQYAEEEIENKLVFSKNVR